MIASLPWASAARTTGRIVAATADAVTPTSSTRWSPTMLVRDGDRGGDAGGSRSPLVLAATAGRARALDRSAHRSAQPPRADARSCRALPSAPARSTRRSCGSSTSTASRTTTTRFGHLAGDALLTRLGRRLRDAVGTPRRRLPPRRRRVLRAHHRPRRRPARTVSRSARGAQRTGRRLHRRPPPRARSRSRAKRATRRRRCASPTTTCTARRRRAGAAPPN